ncbi:MAG: response regulator transcription factor [Gammaproteobacteria bacterium]|nr:response regulator transcription factor [Gammaproteobacteria bacterium]
MAKIRQPSSSRDRHSDVLVLVADDHPLVRFGVQTLLAAQPGVDVVGESASYVETCDAVNKLTPNLVLLDLEMKDATGTEAIEKLRDKFPNLNIIVYTAHNQKWLIVRAIKYGVRGYVLKESANECLCDAVNTVANGGIYLDPTVTAAVTEQLAASGQQQASLEVADLTDRESVILGHIASGKRNKEIAEDLLISERTVKYHVTSMLAKLHARNRAEAVKIATTQRLICL